MQRVRRCCENLPKNGVPDTDPALQSVDRRGPGSKSRVLFVLSVECARHGMTSRHAGPRLRIPHALEANRHERCRSLVLLGRDRIRHRSRGNAPPFAAATIEHLLENQRGSAVDDKRTVSTVDGVRLGDGQLRIGWAAFSLLGVSSLDSHYLQPLAAVEWSDARLGSKVFAEERGCRIIRALLR